MTSLAVWLATVGGAGRVPVAPGTAGSVVGVGLFLLIARAPGLFQVAVVVAVALAGVWASTRAAEVFGAKDPGQVVIDEVAGQLVTLVFTGVTLGGALVGFLVFRFLDIVKPWPANRFERLPGGVGIMADDLMAGLYGNLLLQAAVAIWPGWL